MKILISGATGFIGKHLVARLTGAGYSVCAVVRSSTDTEFFKKNNIDYHVFDDSKDAIEKLAGFMRREKFDGIVHLASLFLAGHAPEDIPGLIDSNIFFGTALLEAAVRSGTPVPWFINTGTFWQHYENEAYSPVNLYAATKQAFEDIALYYIETTGMNFVTIKLSDTFGPGDTRKKIFNLWMKTAAEGAALDMSPGEQLMDVSYIDNVIDGYERMIELLEKDAQRKFAGKSFAVRSGEPMTLRELAALFEQVSGKKLRINWGVRGYRPREVMTPWNTGRKIPGWKPKVSVREGIEKYIRHEQR